MAELSIATVRRYLNGHTPVRAQLPEMIEAAVALVLTPSSDGVDLLLIKRAVVPGDPWSGQIALPGGRRDPADTDLLATARREAREETGLDLARGELLGQLDDLEPVTPTLPPVVVRPFVFGFPARPPVETNHEADSHFWASISALKADAKARQVIIRGREMEVPSSQVASHVVWGMTWRILSPIIDLAD